MMDLGNKPTLVGKKIILRPFNVVEDFPYLEECLKDDEVLEFTGSSPEFNREDTINWYKTRNKPTDRLDLAIIDKSNNILVGEAVVNSFDETNQCMNYRILIGPRGRNQGFGTEATQLMLDYVFNHTDLNQLTLSVFAFNPRALKVYEKAGFVIESVDKNDLEFEGEWIDSINMKLTRGNWMRLLG
ncbi:GNAT family N-acetyltransferase [Virgibacillus sp. DJP39]|uniref:GNAT family N-acetyltransferase n=1 Tax=Virgibacillus sp. DJP39 TaxID=3409790 RepID=UPI003BB71349